MGAEAKAVVFVVLRDTTPFEGGGTDVAAVKSTRKLAEDYVAAQFSDSPLSIEEWEVDA